MNKEPSLPEKLEIVEHAYILAALSMSNGSITGAATILGVKRTTLSEKIRTNRALKAFSAVSAESIVDAGCFELELEIARHEAQVRYLQERLSAARRILAETRIFTPTDDSQAGRQ